MDDEILFKKLAEIFAPIFYSFIGACIAWKFQQKARDEANSLKVLKAKKVLNIFANAVNQVKNKGSDEVLEKTSRHISICDKHVLECDDLDLIDKYFELTNEIKKLKPGLRHEAVVAVLEVSALINEIKSKTAS